MKSILTSIIFLFSLTFCLGDCLDDFQNASASATNVYIVDVINCTSNSRWMNEANYAFQSAIGSVASVYDDCCNIGGSGHPPER